MGLGAGFFPSLVNAHRALGNYDRAFEILEDALDPKRGIPRGRLLLVQAGLLRSARGRKAADEIEPLLDEAQLELERIGWLVYLPSVLIERAALARLRDDEAERLPLLQEAHRLYTEMGATGHAERIARELEP